MKVTRLKLLEVGRFEAQLSVGSVSKASTVYLRAVSSDDPPELPKFRFSLPEESHASSNSGRQVRVALSVFDRNTQQPDLLYGEGETLVSLPLTSEETQHPSSQPTSAYVTSGSKVEALKRVVAASRNEMQLVLTAPTEGFSLGRFRGRVWLRFSMASAQPTPQRPDSHGYLAGRATPLSGQVDQRSLSDSHSSRGSTASSRTVSSGEESSSQSLQWDPINNRMLVEGEGQLSVTQVTVGLAQHAEDDASSGRIEGLPTAPPPPMVWDGLPSEHTPETAAHQLDLPPLGAMATTLSGQYHTPQRHPPVLVAKDEVAQVLAAELKGCREAMQRMGEDILQLRKEKEEVNKELSKYKRLALPEIQQEGASVSLQVLSGMTKPDLVLKTAELQSLCTSLNQQLSAYKEKVVQLQNELIVENDQELDHLQLQEAHKQQQQLLMDLQKKVERYRKCAETCKMQEEVIARLESLVCQEVGRSHGVDAGRAHAVLKEENGHLRGRVKELEYQASLFPHSSQQKGERDDRVQVLIALCHSLEEKVREMTQLRTDSNTDVQFSELEQKLNFVQMELDCVKKQLHISAQSWATEKAQLELTIARMGAGL